MVARAKAQLASYIGHPAIEFIPGSQTSLPLLQSVTGEITTNAVPVKCLGNMTGKRWEHWLDPP